MTAGPVIVVLAGGLATRMGGGDKALRPLGNGTLLDHLLSRLRGQGGPIILSANGDPARFARFGLPVVPDSLPGTLPGRAGPLAGVLAGLEWTAANAPGIADLVSVPGDTPFVPDDLVARLLSARAAAGAELACATSLGRLHPVTALWPLSLAPVLRTALTTEGIHRVDRWTARFRLAQVPFDAVPTDPFFNINTPEDLAAAALLVP